MAHRAHETLAEAVDLFEQFGAQGLFAQLGALEGEGGVVGEGGEDGTVVLRGRESAQREDADRTAGGREGDRAQLARDSGVGAHADGLPGRGAESCEFLVGAARRPTPTTVRTPSSRTSSETPGMSKTAWTAETMVVEQVVDRTVTDQVLGELGETLRHVAAALGLDPRVVETRHDARHGNITMT